MAQQEFSTSNFAVAFIDLLGQRRAMRTHRLLPTDREEQLELLRNTVGPTLRMHERFNEFYASAGNVPSLYKSLTPEQEKEFAWARPGELRSQRFSDGLVVYCSLGEGQAHSPISSVHSLLVASASICLAQLAARHPVRIGVDVGWGVELHPNELYGAAVAHAYELESQVAQWPRVVVGQELMGYLKWSLNVQGNRPEDEFRRHAAGICLSCCIEDTDRSTIIDYAGDRFTVEGHPELLPGVIAPAREFVVDQIAKWTKEGNPTLCGRYQCVRDYLDRRRHSEKNAPGDSS